MPFTAKHLQIFSQNFYRTVTLVFFYQVYNYIYARDFVEIFITVAFTDFYGFIENFILGFVAMTTWIFS